MSVLRILVKYQNTAIGIILLELVSLDVHKLTEYRRALVTEVARQYKVVVPRTLAAFGKIDILINNAGVLDNGLKAIDSFTDEDMNKVIDINTKGTMCMMRAVTAEMAKTGYGSIVNVASVAGVMGCGGAAYVASKAAIIGLTRHTALRFTGTNVRCNAICPAQSSPPWLQV